MKNFSLTQAGIIVAVVGTILVNAGFSQECTNEIVTNAPVIFGGIIAWVGRYRAGGLTLLGTRR